MSSDDDIVEVVAHQNSDAAQNAGKFAGRGLLVLLAVVGFIFWLKRK
jgi:hypothetical protein